MNTKNDKYSWGSDYDDELFDVWLGKWLPRIIVIAIFLVLFILSIR